MSSSIFISYRRADSQGHAQNLHHRLAGWFDEFDEIFFDAENIDSGQNFPQRLVDSIEAAAVVLVLIGPSWLEEINRRAALGEVDFVRGEVQQAVHRLQQGQALRIIPVLLAGATMPSVSALAAPLRTELAPLCALDAHAFQTGKQDDWEHQFVRLRALIGKIPHAPRERYRDRSGPPRPWRVIEHALSASFQDPKRLLSSLREQLLGGSGTAAVVGAGGSQAAALHGMGGIGKTQLALAYCHAYRGTYAGIWWFRADSAGGLADTLLQQDALAACAAAGVAVPKGQVSSQVFKQWLGAQTVPWLLVFDNADDPKALRPYLPGLGPHHVIITSRRPDWGALARAVELSVWTAEQGADFLLQRLGETARRADAQALTTALGGLPLALEQAASYIEASGGGPGQYLDLWRDASADLLNDNDSVATGYERTVAATLALAFKHLSPAAQQLLRLCAFAAPEPLAERFFVEVCEQLPVELGAAAARPLTWDKVVAELKRYALAQRHAIPSLEREWQAGGEPPMDTGTEQALSLHRLTQAVVLHRLAMLPEDGNTLLKVLHEACPDDVENPVHWPRLAALLAHTLWVNETSWADLPTGVQTRTGLLNSAAIFLHFGLALYPQARGIHEQAVAVRRSVQGDEHPDTLTAINNLAQTLAAQGDLGGARKLHEEVLAGRRRVLGEEHQYTMSSMNNLALALEAQGDLVGACGLHKQSLALQRRVLGEEHPYTLVSMDNLAGTLAAQGNLAGARTLQELVVDGHRRVLGKEHPNTLISMNNLAATLRKQGDLAEARWLVEQVLAVYLRVLGEEHPYTLISMSHLAKTLRAQGDLVGARDLEEQVLTGRRSVLGEEHPNTLTSMNNLADTLMAQGDLAGAHRLQERALAVRRRVLGEEHPDTLTSMNNVAISLWHLVEHADATNLMERAAKGRAATLGAEHPDAMSSAKSLAMMRSAES